MNLVCDLNLVDLIEIFYFIKRKGCYLFRVYVYIMYVYILKMIWNWLIDTEMYRITDYRLTILILNMK